MKENDKSDEMHRARLIDERELLIIHIHCKYSTRFSDNGGFTFNSFM